MVVPNFQARQLSLPQSSSSSSPQITSILFDSTTSSLALLHSDSSFSLYPSFSSTSSSSSSLSFPQTFISAPTSSAAFLPLQNPNFRRLLFLVSSPSHGGASVLLRFWILRNTNYFVRARVICNHCLLNYDTAKSGVVFNVSHGASVMLKASVNVFVMYSVSNRMLWVFAVKMIGEEEFDDIKLMKTAVIDCCLPIFCLNVSFGFLILGEFNGVRVFQLQPLVKGNFLKNSSSRIFNLSNGKVQVINGGDQVYSNSSSSSRMNVPCDGSDGKIDKHSTSTKLRSAKLRQDLKEGCVSFVSFKGDGDSFNWNELQLKPVKAITIEALSPNEFLIMDSVGRIHHLRLYNSVLASEVSCHMKQLSHSINVQRMAVLPDLSSRAHTFWISDGLHTVHTVSLSDPDTSINGSDRKDDEEKLIQISVTPAIFTSEKIQQLVPAAANAVLILGQGSIFAYAVS